MASKKVSVTLFYDVISPYSWFAFETLIRYQPVWNFQLCLRPFFLGGVMTSSGNKPPGMVPAKAAYMGRDLKRLAKFFDVPMRRREDPAEFLFNKGSLKAQRLLTAVGQKQGSNLAGGILEKITRQLWLTGWSQHGEIYAKEDLELVLANAGVSNGDSKELLTAIDTDNVKKELKETTAEATEKYGAFGSPIIIMKVGEKEDMFFGSDRFELMASCYDLPYHGPCPEKGQAKL